MTSFSESNFVKKLGDLNNTQQSIQTLSLWLIHHRKHAKAIVNVWNIELRKAQGNKKLTFMYLANDVIQNSKKKGSEFITAFEASLPKAFGHAYRNGDEKTKSSLNRLLTIWKERNVYHRNVLRHVKQALNQSTKSPSVIPEPKTGVVSQQQQPPPIVKRKLSDKTQLSLTEEIESIERGEPPDPEVMANALNDLENSASSDAAVREKIAALPAEVSDLSYLDRISDKLEAESFDATVEESCNILSTYNARLAQELEDRKKVAVMLRDFIRGQKLLLENEEHQLEEYRSKQKQVNVIREEIKSHIQNLPDLSLLPDVTGGLAPLPSAGDLFSI